MLLSSPFALCTLMQARGERGLFWLARGCGKVACFGKCYSPYLDHALAKDLSILMRALNVAVLGCQFLGDVGVLIRKGENLVSAGFGSLGRVWRMRLLLDLH